MNTKPKKNKRGGPRPGSGRPAIYDEPRTVISASVPESTAHRAREHAQQSGETISAVVTDALSAWLESIEGGSQATPTTESGRRLADHAAATGQDIGTVIEAAAAEYLAKRGA